MASNIVLSKDICIRKLDPVDMGRVRELIAGSAVFSESEIHDAMGMLEYYAEFPENDELLTYVCSIGNEIVGFVSFGVGLGRKSYEMYWICVSPAHQSNGVGSSLLKFAEDHVMSLGGRLIFIETSSNKNYERARAFYEHREYKISAVVKDYFDEGDDKIIYSKRLHYMGAG